MPLISRPGLYSELPLKLSRTWRSLSAAASALARQAAEVLKSARGTPRRTPPIDISFLKHCLYVAAILLTAMHAIPAAAQEPAAAEWNDPRFGLHLAYPAAFVPVPSESPVLLILKARSANFPVFNIIVEPGSYDPSAPLEQQERAVVDSYHRVGFTSAKAVRSETVTAAARKAYQAALLYDSAGTRMISLVTIVPADNKHFILTYVLVEADYNRAAIQEYEQLLQAFAAPPPSPAAAEAQRRLLPLLLLAAAVAAAALLAWRHSRKTV